MSDNTHKSNYAGTRGGRNKQMIPILNGSYRLNLDDAKYKLEQLRKTYTISRLSDEDDDMSLVLWISYFEITDEEKKKGYKGNYAKIYILEIKKDLYSFGVDKLEEPLKSHPMRVRPKGTHMHPDPGHPILRGILKGKTYETRHDAYHALNQLQEEYPRASVPAHDKLYLQVYSKQYGTPPIKKFILEIVKKGGEVTIEMRENEAQSGFIRQKIDETYDDIYMVVPDLKASS